MTTKNLIKTGKRISVLILMFFSSGLLLGNRSKDMKDDGRDTAFERDTIFYLTFTETFSRDYVDVYINNKEVVKNACLSSDLSTGLTHLCIAILYRDRTYYACSSPDGEKFIKLPDSCGKGINVHISYNGMLVEFKLAKNKGKYIYIRSDREHLKLIQSHRIFSFY